MRKNKEETKMHSLYFVITVFVAAVCGLVGAILGWNGAKALLDPAAMTNNQWAALVAGLILVAVAIILAFHLREWRGRSFVLLRKLMRAQTAYRRDPTPANADLWEDAKFNFDLHLGRVELTAGRLRFNQEESTTELRLPPDLGDSPVGADSPPTGP